MVSVFFFFGIPPCFPPPTSNQKSLLGKTTIRVVSLVQACFPNLPIFYMSVCERLPAIASTCASRVHQGWILSHGAAKKVYGHFFCITTTGLTEHFTSSNIALNIVRCLLLSTLEACRGICRFCMPTSCSPRLGRYAGLRQRSEELFLLVFFSAG